MTYHKEGNVIQFPVISRPIPSDAPQIQQFYDPALKHRVDEIVKQSERLLKENKND